MGVGCLLCGDLAFIPDGSTNLFLRPANDPYVLRRSSTKTVYAVCSKDRQAKSGFQTIDLTVNQHQRNVVCFGRGTRGRKPYVRVRDKLLEYERRQAQLPEEDDSNDWREASELNEIFELEELSTSEEPVARRKLPIESNGPPLMILHPYISTEKAVDGQRLRPLPLPSPFKLRPARLPRPSLRRKLGIIGPRKQDSQVVEFVQNLGTQIQSLPDEIPVSELLDKWERKLKKGALSRVVKYLGQVDLTGRALEVLSWMQTKPLLWPDDITLCSVIHVLVSGGELDKAMELHRGVARDSSRAAQTLSSALAKHGFLEEAIEVVAHMADRGWEVDCFVCTTITEWACKTGSRFVAVRLWGSVDLSRVKLQLQDYTSLLTSCSKMGLVDVVDRLHQDFVRSGLQANVVLYTTLMKVLGRQERYREAAAIFWEMEEAGCKPDIRAYEVMLEICAKLDDLTKALKVHKDLVNAGYTATSKFYNTLIPLLVRKGLPSRARDLLKEMLSIGHIPSEETLSRLPAGSG